MKNMKTIFELIKTILKVSYLIIILSIALEKGECFDFNHSLVCLPYSVHP